MMTEYLILGLIALVSSLILTPLVGKFMRSIGKIGNDVFKPNLPEVPEAGGIGFMIVFLVLLGVGIFLAPTQGARNRFIISLVVLTLVVILGLVDDFIGMSALMKPFLLVIIALPVFIFRNIGGEEVADPTPVLPFVGETQLTIVYWFLAVFVVAIPANSSNMLDVMNGTMSGSGILVLLTAFLSSFIIPLPKDSQYFTRYSSIVMISLLLGFWWFNRYPASIFAGDTGSLGVGATIGLIAIYGQIEFVLVVALLVHIMNSFSIISSVGGLRERREMSERPVQVEDGVIYASRHPNAPITLVRLIVAREPTTEDRVIRQILILVGYSCILALISAYLIRLEVIS